MLTSIIVSTILAFVALSNGIMSLAVYRRDPNKIENKYFSSFLMLVSFWAISNLLIILPESQNIIDFGLALFYIVPALTVNFVLLFSLVFQREYKIPLPIKATIYGLSGAMITAVIVWPEFFYGDVVVMGDALNEVPIDTPGFYILGTFFIAYFVIGYSTLFRTYKRSRGLAKLQMRYAVIGIVASSVLGVFTNLILPVFFDVRHLWLGPAMTIVFSMSIMYAIFKHHLFDIRIIVARLVTYGLTIIAAAGVYVLLSWLFIDNVFVDAGGIYHEILYVLFALLVAWVYPVFRDYFDLLSRKMIESGYYDIDEVQDQISDVLTEEINIDKIIARSNSVFASSIKPTFVRFVVFKDDAVFKDDNLGLSSPKEIEFTSLDHLENDISVSEDIMRGKGKTLFRTHKAELILKLNSSSKLIGAIIFGPKASGAIYTEQDLRFFGHLAKEISIAIDNSLNFEQLQTFNVNLKRRIRRAVHNLEVSNEELKQMDKTKDEFVSLASHQLRTPLTSIKGYISMILEGDAGDINDDQRKLLSEAFASSERMVYLIADLLNVSRLQAGTFIIDRSEVHLPTVIRDEMNQVRETAKSAHIELQYNEPKNFPNVYIDETKIRQVIMNFIDNAIYYTPSGGNVVVKLSHTNKNIEITVKDSGIGVPKQAQKDLFKRFFRADNAKKARPDGTGIGLYMAKKVVTAQGGAIIFRSEEGKGSTFGFTLPLSKIKVPHQD